MRRIFQASPAILQEHAFKVMLCLCFAFSATTWAQKELYIPQYLARDGVNLNDPNAQWSYSRSLETENYIIFWEPGFGENPSTAPAPYTVDMEVLQEVAEQSFAVNVDSLHMVIKGNSLTDNYKQMIFLLYTTDWAAFGAGQDERVGSLHVNPAAANAATVVAHEIGHSFQYMTGADEPGGGYRWGLGTNGEGGNGFWEQMAQWQSFQVYPDRQFRAGDFNTYIRNNHLHILHEDPRYANYFLPDYWAWKQGRHFLGQLWREAIEPEDPVDTYKRLTGVSQDVFNDEMYEHASRLTTWDLPRIRSYGENYIDHRSQVVMSELDDGFWAVDSAVAPENYGYNSIKLNVPAETKTVGVAFEGLAGTQGYRSLNMDLGGWRYGFVALLDDGTRVYSDMSAQNVVNGTNPTDTLRFMVPPNSERLWFVVSGSPQEHWHHEWDDDNTNDEQWPYKVKFYGTNLLGEPNGEDIAPLETIVLEQSYDVTMQPRSDYNPITVYLKSDSIAEFFGIPAAELSDLFGKEIFYSALNPDESINPTSTAMAPGHWFDTQSSTVSYGDNAQIYSELDLDEVTASIGQYPDRVSIGDSYTIRQVLSYHKNADTVLQVQMSFKVHIAENVSTQNQQINVSAHSSGSAKYELYQEQKQILFNSPSGSTIHVYNLSGKELFSASAPTSGAGILPWEETGIQDQGLYIVQLRAANGHVKHNRTYLNN